jgi:hypothetical protein
MWRIVGVLFFAALVCIRCWVAYRAYFPEYKGFAAVSVLRMVLVAAIGISALWMSGFAFQVIVIVCLGYMPCRISFQ